MAKKVKQRPAIEHLNLIHLGLVYFIANRVLGSKQIKCYAQLFATLTNLGSAQGVIKVSDIADFYNRDQMISNSITKGLQ